jgi:hypothetical protein
VFVSLVHMIGSMVLCLEKIKCICEFSIEDGTFLVTSFMFLKLFFFPKGGGTFIEKLGTFIVKLEGLANQRKRPVSRSEPAVRLVFINIQ